MPWKILNINNLIDAMCAIRHYGLLNLYKVYHSTKCLATLRRYGTLRSRPTRAARAQTRQIRAYVRMYVAS